MEIQKQNDYPIFIHNKEEYNKFKKYAQKVGKSPEKLLYEIHAKIGIPKKERGHFGPKTIKYLEKIYKQEKVKKVLSNPEEYSEELTQGQTELNGLNENTSSLISKNNLNVKLNLGYDSGNGEGRSIDTIKTDSVQSYESSSMYDYNPSTGSFEYIEGKTYYVDSDGKTLTTQGNDLENALNNQVNNETIRRDQEIKQLLMEDFGINIGTIDTKKKTPIDILGDMYKNASEDQKIKMAMVLGKFMSNHYDNDMANGGDTGDISSEEMWEIYKNDGVAGVCRHMHSEVAMFLEKAGITAGTITTNSGGRHAITLGKKEDGSYFLIDYGNYFQSKDFIDLQNSYLANHGSIDLSEYISKADGEIIKIIKTGLEQSLSNTSSSTSTSNSLAYSKFLAKNGIQLINGTNINTSVTNNDKSLDLSYGQDTKYGHYSGGLFYKEDTAGLGYTSKVQSYGAYVNGKWGNRDGKAGELGVGTKVARHNISWTNGKKANYNTISANVDWTKRIVNTNQDEVNIGASAQGTILFDQTNRGDNYSLMDTSFGKVEDAYGNLGATIDWKHQINSNWESNLGLMYGADIGVKNQRSDELTLYSKYGAYGGIKYHNDDLTAYLDGSYEKGLGYKKHKVSGGIKKDKTEVYANYTKETDTTHFNFGDKVSKTIGVKYNIKDALQASVDLYENENYGRTNSGVRAGIQYKF